MQNLCSNPATVRFLHIAEPERFPIAAGAAPCWAGNTTGGTTMTVNLNQRARQHAKDLIESRKVVH